MGTRKALIPLTALAVLGTACGTTAPIQKAPEDVIHEVYYTGAGLKFEGDIDGQHVRRYERLDAGHTDIFLEVVSEDGIVIVYGNDIGPSWREDPTIEWVAIPAEDEIRLYENNRITLIKDGEKTRLDYHEGIGEPVLKEAQAQYDTFMAVIDGFDEQQEQEYYETTLKPLQEWALEELTSEPEQLEPQMGELPEQLRHKYLANAELVFNEVVDGERVRLYERTEFRNLDDRIIIVDREDGTSVFYQDWQETPDLDTVAITKDGVTQFYERNVLEVFKDGTSERFYVGFGNSVHAEAQPQYKDYLFMLNSRIGTYKERHPDPTIPLQQEALETLRGH